MIPQCVFFDLDGTAVENGSTSATSPRLLSSIANASRSLSLCAATGRPWANAKGVLQSLGLTDPCIVGGGSKVIDPQSGKVLRSAALPLGSVRHILDSCIDLPNEILFDDERIGEGSIAVDRLSDAPAANVVYVMGCSSDEALAITASLSAVSGLSVVSGLAWNGGGVDLHITSQEGTKGQAVAWVAHKLGVSREATLGVGDGANDIPLFHAVGLSVAMGNATREVKDSADMICGSIDDDGLALLLESLLTQQELEEAS